MKIDYSLYLVTNREILGDLDLLKIVKKALKSGVSVVQLREKNLNKKEFLKIALKMKKLTDKYKIPLIINDDIYIAKKVNASGVHLGQDDENIKLARKILGKRKIIGISVRDKKEALLAQKNGADYLGVGSIFFTPTKKDIKKPIGIKKLKNIVNLVKIPTVAIGGINEKNFSKVINTKVDGIAVISAILKSKNIKKTCKKLRKGATCKK